MLGDLFYLIGFILFLVGFAFLYKTTKIVSITDWAKKFKKVTGKFPSEGDFRSKEEWSLTLGFGFTSIFTSIWLFVGLLSNSWLVFLLILALGLLTNILNKFSNIFFMKINININSIVRVLTIGFLVLNHFHLHLDLTNILLNYIKIII